MTEFWIGGNISFFIIRFLTGCITVVVVVVVFPFVFLREIIQNYFTVQLSSSDTRWHNIHFPMIMINNKLLPHGFSPLETATTTTTIEITCKISHFYFKESKWWRRDCIICYWLFKFKENFFFNSKM